jgi:guanidinoacetate N-methyltransferase
MDGGRSGHTFDGLAFEDDERGDPILVMKPDPAAQQADKTVPYKGDNQVVMMQWEKQYMEACVERLDIGPGKSVCEIGFGLGFSADRIQSKQPAAHYIVECSSVVLERLEKWAEDKPSVVIVRGFWQEQLPTLGKFDALFFDDFPLPNETSPQSTDDLAEVNSRWVQFMHLCIEWHTKPGACISGYLARPIPLQHPSITYTTEEFLVDVPTDCPYLAPGEQLLYIPTIRKASEPTALMPEVPLTNSRARRKRARFMEKVLAKTALDPLDT